MWIQEIESEQLRRKREEKMLDETYRLYVKDIENAVYIKNSDEASENNNNRLNKQRNLRIAKKNLKRFATLKDPNILLNNLKSFNKDNNNINDNDNDNFSIKSSDNLDHFEEEDKELIKFFGKGPERRTMEEYDKIFKRLIELKYFKKIQSLYGDETVMKILEVMRIAFLEKGDNVICNSVNSSSNFTNNLKITDDKFCLVVFEGTLEVRDINNPFELGEGDIIGERDILEEKINK